MANWVSRSLDNDKSSLTSSEKTQNNVLQHCSKLAQTKEDEGQRWTWCWVGSSQTLNLHLTRNDDWRVGNSNYIRDILASRNSVGLESQRHWTRSIMPRWHCLKLHSATRHCCEKFFEDFVQTKKVWKFIQISYISPKRPDNLGKVMIKLLKCMHLKDKSSMKGLKVTILVNIHKCVK